MFAGKKTTLLIVAMCLLISACAPLLARRAASLVARRVATVAAGRAIAQTTAQDSGQATEQAVVGTEGQNQLDTRSSQEERSPEGGGKLPLGTYRIIHDTRLFPEPRQDTAPITWLREGTKVKVVEIVEGKWLKVESFHPDRPPGYLRQEDAVAARK